MPYSVHDKETKTKRPRDVNQLAKRIVDIATGQVEDREQALNEQGKDPAAVDLGRRGGLRAVNQELTRFPLHNDRK